MVCLSWVAIIGILVLCAGLLYLGPELRRLLEILRARYIAGELRNELVPMVRHARLQYEDHQEVAQYVITRLQKRYPEVDPDDLMGYVGYVLDMLEKDLDTSRFIAN